MARGKKPAEAGKSNRPRVGSDRSQVPAEKPATSDYCPKTVPLHLQQKCLTIFQNALNPGDNQTSKLQEVKGHLFNRDFAAAFGKEEYLRIYASRWSPSRALAYMQVLADIDAHAFGTLPPSYVDREEPIKVVCLGGGAGAEIVALAGWMHLASSDTSETQRSRKMQAQFLDIAAWDIVLKELHKAVTTPPELSKYASAAARKANISLVTEEEYNAEFQQIDALQISDERSNAVFGNADLVTLMFTLNELYSVSMPKTQQMLAGITTSVRPGAFLLVVDSPGSYSTISINGAEKKYPMQWLLDLTLLGSQQQRADDSTPAKWEKVISDNSRWFRLPQGLRYPISLENMRYQIHLYRRVEGDDQN